MMKPEWKCAASHCRGKSHISHPEMRRVWRCGKCKKLYHTGCSGGHPSQECDECWVKSTQEMMTP